MGYKRPLTEKDTWELQDRDMCQKVGENFKKIWEKEIEKSRLDIHKIKLYLNNTS